MGSRNKKQLSWGRRLLQLCKATVPSVSNITLLRSALCQATTSDRMIAVLSFVVLECVLVTVALILFAIAAVVQFAHAFMDALRLLVVSRCWRSALRSAAMLPRSTTLSLCSALQTAFLESQPTSNTTVTERVILLEYLPQLGMTVGILAGALCSPATILLKLLRFVQGRGCPSVVRGDTAPYIRLAPIPGAVDTSICELSVFEVNGAKHVVRIRGHDSSNPIMMYCHGGPAASEMFAGADHGLRLEHLERDFVVVDYDQRSAMSSGAINFYEARRRGSSSLQNFIETLTIEQHVSDLIELVTKHILVHPSLRGSSSVKRGRVHLCGGSWGSVLALRAAAERPGLFESPIVVRGLVTHDVTCERLAHEFLTDCINEERSRDPKRRERLLARLDALRGVPPGSFHFIGRQGIEQMLKQRSLLTAYGGQTWREFDHFKRCRSPRIQDWAMMAHKAWEATLSLEMSIPTMLSATSSLKTTLECMSELMWGSDETVQPRHIGGGLSVVVAHGAVDRCTSFTLVESFLQSELTVDCGARKSLVWFKKSGHSPDKEEPTEFAALLRAEWLRAASIAERPDSRCKYPSIDIT